MTTRQASRTRWRFPIAVAAGALVAAAGLLWLWCMYIALRSRLSTDPLTDPHGYELIAGTVPALPAAAVVALAVPFIVAPGPGRARLAKTVATPLVALTALSLIALFAT
ncbi:hypothetical protein [Nocardia camponoti]|uniref:Uncharacterized protein n=1 Tax=Nocardia camponoti TaxID=1616106 RepID=A0A917QRQ9_9NOCA|nr:hypothetical protein [Nocardia camponoti]GGK65097.1 hypothetical protein GCM10011591_41680 [Nocardia camponoti]